MTTGDSGTQPGIDNQPAVRQADVVSTRSRQVVIDEEWSGPLPDPDALERYEGLIPGSGERFLAVFEAEVAHRQNLENMEFARESRRMDWGLGAAFFAVTMIIGAGTFLIFVGHDWAGGGLIGVNIVGLAAVFVRSSMR
jgi:uncharacterized membrane protein